MNSRRIAVPLVLLSVLVLAGIAAVAGRRGAPSVDPPPRAHAVLASYSAPSAPARSEAAPPQGVGTELFRTIARDRNPIVVSIMTQSRVKASDLMQGDGGDDFFRRFFGTPMEPRDQLQRGLGSGFIVSSDGEILTNNHVVAGAEQIRVGLFQDDRKTYAATVLGRDPLTDSALIKLQDAPGNLPTAPLGNSDALEPGDWVMAIGNPFQLGHTVTVGVVSFPGRPFAVSEGRFQDMLQTDASINPGNSGGPLIDTRGEVVGINAAIFSEGGRGNIGIGFAVPINTVKALLPQLREGKVHRSRLGVRIQSIPMTDEEAASLGLPKPEGAIVSMVEPDSPAGHAGLGAGDVIVEFGGTTVTDGSQLTALVAAARPGSRVPIAYYRRGKRATTTATLDELVLEEERVENRGAAATTGFGLSLEDLPRDAARQLRLPAGTVGALVADVAPFTPAADAGIQPGDVILEVNRAPVRSARDTGTELRKVGPGKLAFLLVSRQGNQMFLEIRKG